MKRLIKDAKLFYITKHNLQKELIEYNVHDYIHQLGVNNKPEIDVMHICTPFNEETFVKQTTDYINLVKPKLTIIHSTIAVGTTKEIIDETNGEFFVVHSPVVGVHPNLTEGILTFTKSIGGFSDEATELAENHLNELNVNTVVYDDANTTEAAKLFSTSYYGWNIMFNKEVMRFCEEHTLNFEQVYSNWNENYNKGYAKLDMKHVRRPVLDFIPGAVGGHCIQPNYKILDEKHNVKLAKVWRELHDDAL